MRKRRKARIAEEEYPEVRSTEVCNGAVITWRPADRYKWRADMPDWHGDLREETPSGYRCLRCGQQVIVVTSTWVVTEVVKQFMADLRG